MTDNTSSLESFRLRRLAALRKEKQANVRREYAIDVCEACGRPIDSAKVEAFCDSEGIWFHAACWSGDESDDEPDDDDVIVDDEPDAGPALARPTRMPTDDAPANEPTVEALGPAFVELVQQIRRLRRTPCPTTGFDFSEAGVMRSLEHERAELVGATEPEHRRGEAGDMLGVMIDLADLVAGDGLLLDVVRGQVEKLRFRLDHIDAGGTWASAKAAERGHVAMD